MGLSLVCSWGLFSCGPVGGVDPPAEDPSARARVVSDIDFTAFPPGFMWGVGSSSHQFEGNDVDSDWWQWELAGNTKTGEVSGLAADHWNRYEEDFDRLVALNLDTYRFSLSWARLYPRPGMIAPDPDAVAHYDEVLAALARRNIRPMVTLHHFTMPHWLTEQDRWASGEAIEDFLQLARFAARRWGDQVDWWITINEPHVFALHGWWHGVFPPGKTDLSLAISVYVNLMKAHAEAYHLIKETDTTDAEGDGVAARVGVARLIVPAEPFSPSSLIEQIIVWQTNAFQNWFWFDLNQTGIPELTLPSGQVIEAYPRFRDTLDFIGVNYYSRQVVCFVPFLGVLFDPLSTGKRGMLGHEIYPQGLYDALATLARYDLPLIITEHGVADDTDVLRQEAIVGHLAALTRFMTDYPDVRVLGYMHWALTDHFEWENGFRPRFGLYAIDYATQQRTPRPSTALLAELVAASKQSER